MLLMNGYLRKAQHDENNLNIEATVEVISDFKVKKASVFNGFKRQTTKSTVSRPLVAHHSSQRDKNFGKQSTAPNEAVLCYFNSKLKTSVKPYHRILTSTVPSIPFTIPEAEYCHISKE